MNCAKMKELLVDYAEDSLSGRKKIAVEHHLAQCEACLSELSKIRELKENLLLLQVPERDEEFWQRFNRKLARKLAHEKDAVAARRPVWLQGLSLGAVAAAILLVVVSLIGVPRPGERDQTTSKTAVGTMDEYTISWGDLEGEHFVYVDDDMRLALADLSYDEVEQFHENTYSLIDQSWEYVPGDAVLDDSYEGSIYDVVEDLSLDLSLEEYEAVYEELTSI